jgi:hypothetical protein
MGALMAFEREQKGPWAAVLLTDPFWSSFQGFRPGQRPGLNARGQRLRSGERRPGLPSLVASAD